MNITIMWMKEWVELYTFCKIRVSTLTVKRTFSRIQNPLQIFSSVAIEDRIIMMEEKNYSPEYIEDQIKTVKSWLRHFDV